MPDFAPFLERAFDLDLPDGPVGVGRVEGELPPFLRGTYYLNGPARFGRDGTRYRHWLDGDGRVTAVRFDEGRVTATARFVRTAKWEAEEAAGRAVFRTFGTGAGENRLKLGVMTESPANVSVHAFAGRLLAFGEQSLPYELDPETLATRGTFTFGGALNGVSPFAAHPRFDPDTGEMFNFGVAFSATGARLHVYRFAADGRLLGRHVVGLPFPCSVHDFALSPRYAVFHLGPYLLDFDTFREKGRTLMDSLSWEPARGSQLLLVNRETGEPVSAPAGSGYCLHCVNAFEDGGQVCLDAIEFERPVYDQYLGLPDMFVDTPLGHPVRFAVDPSRPDSVRRQVLTEGQSVDFPVTAPGDAGKTYAEFWMLGISASGAAGRKFFDQLIRCDWADRSEVYQAPPHHYLAGEPAVVPDPAGRQPALLVPIFDAERVATALAVFDAHAVGKGLVAQVRLDRPQHLGFHATFVPTP